MSPRNPFTSRSRTAAPSPSADDDHLADQPDLGDAGAYRPIPAELPTGRRKQTEKWLRKVLHRAVGAQTGPAQKYVRNLRARRPDASPAQIRQAIDDHFLTIVTTAGTAAGATATVPGLGTMAAFGAVTADAAAFLEAVTFHTIATAIVQGVDVHAVEQREILVSIVVLGSSGNAIVQRATKGRKGSLAKRATQVPDMAQLNNVMVSRLAKKFVLSRIKGSWTKFLPIGIGAILGGWGNRKAGRLLLGQSREVFGAPPAQWPNTPELAPPSA